MPGTKCAISGTKSEAAVSAPLKTASGRSAAANQIDDYYHQRYNQQQVNQTTGNMQAKPQQPQNQKHSDNGPKHSDLLVNPFLIHSRFIPDVQFSPRLEPPGAACHIPNKASRLAA
jgi:hypothetical protein